MSEDVELSVESIAAGGDGVGRHGGLVVFVPRTAPGDRAVVRIRRSRRFARGEALELLERSAQRVEPACVHYERDRCGGCQLQHINYAWQLEAKARMVRDALQRIGSRRAPVSGVEPSPRRWRYRRKLTLAIRRRDGRVTAGLHPYDAPDRVFHLEDCPITDERVLAVWRSVLSAADLLPPARSLRGAVRVSEEPDGVGGWCSLVLEGGRSWRESESFFGRVAELSELWWIDQDGRRTLLHHRGERRGPGASFAQVNPEVAAALARHVVSEALGRSPATAVDAYAGTGDMALALARGGVRVRAIELDEDAAAFCADRLPPGSRAVAARVENALPAELPADVVILNPPRTGVHERVTTVLSAQPPRALIYVSCNPATLSRDLARMPRMAIRSLALFDMFPQTAHIETVCVMEPEDGS